MLPVTGATLLVAHASHDGDEAIYMTCPAELAGSSTYGSVVC
jgi:hypothetical protein